jgi:hypothetical protein
MKAKARQTLTQLVALKRQRAEQALAEAHAALREAREDLLTARLQLQTPTAQEDFQSIRLAEQNGHSTRLLAQIREREELVRAREGDLAARTDALRKAFGSEQLLDEVTSGSN